MRPLAVLAFVSAAAVRAAAAGLLRAPAIMLRLGWAPVPSRAGDTARHRHPAGRQPEARPCHPTTVRDALRRSGAAAWAPAQRAGVQARYARGLVRGTVSAIDGTGLGAGLRLVAVVCVSGACCGFLVADSISGRFAGLGPVPTRSARFSRRSLPQHAPQARGR